LKKALLFVIAGLLEQNFVYIVVFESKSIIACRRGQ